MRGVRVVPRRSGAGRRWDAAAVCAVAATVALSGCGGQDAEESAGGSTASGSASATASASTSASGSASASPSASPVSKQRAASATKKALLPDAAFDKVGLKVDDPPKEGKWDWFDTCRPFLPSESRQVTGYHGKWKGGGDIVSQTVVAYPDGVAEDVVEEVRSTVTCKEYAGGEARFTGVEPMELPAIDDADATHAWCMRQDEKFYVCHSVLAAQDLLSNIWVASDDKSDAQKALAALSQLAAARIATQIR